MIALHAGAAHGSARSDSDRSLQALELIENTARATLSELRSLLGVLRAPEHGVSSPNPPLRPAPSLRQLDELVEIACAAGLEVTIDMRGEPAELHAAVDLAAFRVIQEALTNVIKHAPGACVCVELHYEPERLLVAVLDHGSAGTGASEPEGHGLAMMRERVQLAGGTLRAGALSDGGFAVRAQFPLGERARRGVTERLSADMRAVDS